MTTAATLSAHPPRSIHQLSLLPHRVADDPGALRSVRHLLDEESRRMNQWIALQISTRLR